MIKPAIIPRKGARNHLFDLSRIFFALLVLLSHSFELVDGDRHRELFARITHSSMSFGEFGVDGFFLLSGFLIVQSWDRDPELLNFLRKRILRIVPGYLVAALLSTWLIGWVAPDGPGFFHHLGWPFVKSLATLSSPDTPQVFPGTMVRLVDGAMWTIAYEFRAYLVVAAFGVCGLLGRRAVWLVLTLFLLAALASGNHIQALGWHTHKALLGDIRAASRLYAIFFVGGTFYLFRDRIRFARWTAALVALVFLAGTWLARPEIELAVAVCGAYLFFFAADRLLHTFDWMSRVPDVSYGTYLYGWPLLGLLIWRFRLPPWSLFACASAASLTLGWISWHVIERPMLKLKVRATAPLPPA